MLSIKFNKPKPITKHYAISKLVLSMQINCKPLLLVYFVHLIFYFFLILSYLLSGLFLKTVNFTQKKGQIG